MDLAARVGFEGASDGTWLDVVLARVRLGPVLSPWVANGALSGDGERLRLGDMGRRVSVDAAADRCTVRIPYRGGSVTTSASAPAAAFVEWDDAAPDPARDDATAGAAYELGRVAR